MSSNEETLKIWEDNISSYNRLKFNDAKALYIECLDTGDNEKRQQLILGTLYIVVSLIKNHKLYSLTSGSYDINDLISACNKVYIDKLDEGVLLRVKSFSQIFNESFFNSLSKEIKLDEFEIGSNFLVTGVTFGYYLKKYIEYRKNNERCSFNDFRKLFTEDYRHPSYYIDSELCSNTLILYESVYRYLSINDELLDMSKTELKNLKYILIQGGLEVNRVNIDDVSVDNEDIIVENLSIKNFINMIFNSDILDDREKKIMMMHFGFGHDISSFEEIAEEIGISTARVGQIEVRALRKIRSSRLYKKGKNLY